MNNHSLVEITRKNILGKTKSQTPLRYAKRLSYRSKGYKLDTSKLLSDDQLVAQVAVGDYICTIEYTGVLATLQQILKTSPVINLQSVIRAVTKSFDNPDVLVNCTCSDFKYRYAYVSSKFGYKYGDPENRPAKITNPYNRGGVCKHLAALLANKTWMIKVSSEINRFIRSNYDEILDKLGYAHDEVIARSAGRPRMPDDQLKHPRRPKKVTPGLLNNETDTDGGDTNGEFDQT